jgi:hypothetical protein
MYRKEGSSLREGAKFAICDIVSTTTAKKPLQISFSAAQNARKSVTLEWLLKAALERNLASSMTNKTCFLLRISWILSGIFPFSILELMKLNILFMS